MPRSEYTGPFCLGITTISMLTGMYSPHSHPCRPPNQHRPGPELQDRHRQPDDPHGWPEGWRCRRRRHLQGDILTSARPDGARRVVQSQPLVHVHEGEARRSRGGLYPGPPH